MPTCHLAELHIYIYINTHVIVLYKQSCVHIQVLYKSYKITHYYAMLRLFPKANGQKTHFKEIWQGTGCIYLQQLTGLHCTHSVLHVGIVLPTRGELSRFLLTDPPECTTLRAAIYIKTTHSPASPKQQRNAICKQTGHMHSCFQGDCTIAYTTALHVHTGH